MHLGEHLNSIPQPSDQLVPGREITKRNMQKHYPETPESESFDTLDLSKGKAVVPFNNSTTGNFMAYQERFEINLLQLLSEHKQA